TPVAAPTGEPPADGAPPIISRRAWGADEALRFRNDEEIWPRQYRAVEHLVIHHSDTTNFENPLLAIRSIYYYHAVTKGWGDIGYNYLVDFNGAIYEGRAGGEWVVGGHALGYNEGTAGICAMGRFAGAEPTPEMAAGLADIAAWAGRNLDPAAAAPFADIARLPTICGHRDVNPTSCPGDALFGDLGWLREDVQTVLAARAAAPPPDDAARFAAGDAVATTVAGVALREEPGRAAPLITTVAAGEPLTITDGPQWADGMAWYHAAGTTLSGWIAADFLAPAAPSADAQQWVGGEERPDADPAPNTTAALPPGTTAAVTGGDLHLRAAPAGAVLDTLPDGAWVIVTGPPQVVAGVRWLPVDAGLGRQGWVSGDRLRPV
ncbi:MAG: N-acetylmuramoyl-L-alanine amidase, partial [Thermomicrobiales bacterium]|nr:N-acetylmuramoyl-L-alanine amidase [Thermomicrobiales bacterium]